MKTRPRLGRGIDAIFPDSSMDSSAQLVELSMEEISPNPIQPRKEIDDEKIKELSDSIRKNGLISPIVVRRVGTKHEIIAGERRYRAAVMAGLTKLPTLVRDCPDDESFRLSLIENLQREDLNPMDEAEAYFTLCKHFQHTHQDIADAVSKDRSTITNSLRLIGLPEDIKQALRAGRITTGHARALLMLNKYAEQVFLLNQIQNKGLSVRETERIASHAKQRHQKERKKLDPAFDRLSLRLSERFSTKVTCMWGKKKGKIIIEFYSKGELERVASFLAAEELTH